MATENLRLDLVFLEFQDECNAILGEDWVDEAKASLAACTESAWTVLQAQLLPFVLAAGMHWLSDKKMGYCYHTCSDPVRMVLDRVRYCLRISPDLGKPEPEPDRLSFMTELLHNAAAEPISDRAIVGLPSLSDESLQGLNDAELRQKCIRTVDQLNIEMLHYAELAEKYRLQGLELDKVQAECKAARSDRAEMSSSLAQALHRLGELLEALGALEHPDGVIRGPLLDGPELDDLNAAIAKIRGSETGDGPHGDRSTINVPANADVYVYLRGEGDEPAFYKRDRVVVAAEQLLNVTGERGLELENMVGAAMTDSNRDELSARRRLYDAILRTKAIGPDGPLDQDKVKQEVRDAAKQLLLCTEGRNIDLGVRLERNSLTPFEIAEFNARMALITAYGEEYH